MSLDLRNIDGKWLALQVRATWEIRSAYALKEHGYEGLLPLYPQKRRWSDRTKLVDVPLFPGYLFLRFDASNHTPVLSIPGILRFVGTGNAPIPVEDSEIEALQRATQAVVNYGPCAFLEVGQEVEVRNGPLVGLRGRIMRFKNKLRLIISVTLLRKSVFVEIDSYEVTAVSRPTTSPLMTHGLELEGCATPA
ncbi:MAG TPA: transcription termination/antitermination NusG family protein [Candidatus Angelobacter sp.]|jgi:transcription antitermination factor NusG|nr:transcription termination/antitermination NusG family protein [Candidatus Angelobacter sp.]